MRGALIAIAGVLCAAVKAIDRVPTEWTIVGAAHTITDLGLNIAMEQSSIALSQQSGASLSDEEDKAHTASPRMLFLTGRTPRRVLHERLYRTSDLRPLPVST